MRTIGYKVFSAGESRNFYGRTAEYSEIRNETIRRSRDMQDDKPRQ